MKTIPHDQDAERALCGAPFIRPEVVGELDIEPEDFFNPVHQCVWRAARACFRAGRPIDEVTVGDALRAEGRFDAVGGWAALSRMAIVTPSAYNAAHYAGIVKQHALTRRLMLGLSEALETARQGHDGDVAYQQAQEALRAYVARQPSTAIPIRDVVQGRIKELMDIADRRAAGESAFTGVPTGIERLDELLGGLQPGIVTALGGRPGMGKSALALGIADHASLKRYGVHVFSLEDPRRSYADRLLGRASGVPIQAIRACRFTREEARNLRPAASGLIGRSHWLYEDRPGLSAEDIIRAVRRHRRDNETALVIVDYLQLLRWPDKARTEHQAIKHNVYTLADAAMADEMAYLLVAQLNRGPAHREDKRPRESDFRESGSIEERCKCVLGIYRGSNYGEPKPGVDYPKDGPEPTAHEWEHRVDILVLKNNQGETGFVQARWDGPTTRVY